MNQIVESARRAASPTLTEVEDDRVMSMLPVAFTPAAVALCPYAAGGLAAGAAAVGAYEAGRAAAG